MEMDIELESDSKLFSSSDDIPHDFMRSNETTFELINPFPFIQQVDKVQLELVVLDEDDKDGIIKKLKKEQKRKRKINNLLNKKNTSQSQNMINKYDSQQQMCQYQNIFSQFLKRISLNEDFFAYGEIILEGDFYKDPFDIEKTYQWSQWKRGDKVCQLKNPNCTTIEMNRIVNPHQNFEYLIQKYLNVPDQQIHQLGLNLYSYYQKTKLHLQKMQEKGSLFKDKKFKKLFSKLSDEYYNKSLEWLKTQVGKDDIYMYVFYEMDLDNYDQNFKHFGYSNGLLNLIGLDSNNAIPYILRKGRLEFIDGLSRLKRLIGRLNNFNKNNKIYNIAIDHDIISIDDIRIPTKCIVTTPGFSCFTPENFEYYDCLEGEFMVEYALFRIFKYEVNPKIVEHILNSRQSQNENRTINYEYSFLSEIFLDRYYKKLEEEIVVDQIESKACGYRMI